MPGYAPVYRLRATKITRLCACVKPPQEFFTKIVETPVVHTRPNLINQPNGEPQIMDGSERRAEHLFGFEQVVEVRP